MLPTPQKFHTSPVNTEKITVLVVSPHPSDLSAVRQILQNACWQIEHADTLKDAVQRFQQKMPSVILCERELPDGTWHDLLVRTRDLPVVPSVLVISRHADDTLWAEVLSSGAYDVLSKPFDRREMVRVVGMAWRHCSARKSPKSQALEPGFAHAAAS